MRDPYEVLGLKREATPEEIRKAYRKLAKASHPDLHPGDKAAEETLQGAVARERDSLGAREARALRPGRDRRERRRAPRDTSTIGASPTARPASGTAGPRSSRTRPISAACSRISSGSAGAARCACAAPTSPTRSRSASSTRRGEEGEPSRRRTGGRSRSRSRSACATARPCASRAWAAPASAAASPATPMSRSTWHPHPVFRRKDDDIHLDPARLRQGGGGRCQGRGADGERARDADHSAALEHGLDPAAARQGDSRPWRCAGGRSVCPARGRPAEGAGSGARDVSQGLDPRTRRRVPAPS